MKSTHVQQETLARLARRELEPSELKAVLRHLGECDECEGRASAGLDEQIDSLLAAPAAHDDSQAHLDADSELPAYVDGTMSAADREIAEAHLEDCAICRGEAGDLQALRVSLSRRRTLWPFAIAAAVAAIALLVLVPQNPSPRVVTKPAVRQPAPIRTPAAPTYANAEWEGLVRAALLSSRLPFPADLDSLKGRPDALRSEGEHPAAGLSPAGIVIDDPRPRFSWPRRKGSTYFVSIFDGRTEVASSGPLDSERWTPPRPLQRGRTYTWQVDARMNGEVEVMPAVPSPPAMFRIVGAREHESIMAAREGHSGDHLLLSVLHARAGMEVEAKRHLRQLAASPDPRVRQLLRETLR